MLVLVTENSSAHKTYKIDIANNGLGPALIKSFEIRIGERKIDGTHSSVVMNMVRELFPEVEYTSTSTGLSANYCMPSNELCNLLTITFSPESNIEPDEIVKRLDSADLRIEYESLYGEKYDFDSKD